MKFKRAHTRNGVRYEVGAAFVGDTNTGRFLYQRGVLEPDGSPGDDLITRNPSRRAGAWGIGEDLAVAPGVTPVHTGGGMYDVGQERVQGKDAANARANELNTTDSTAWATPGEKE